MTMAGVAVLDLFAGSGALGIEALSRGAGRAVFVDRSAAAAITIRANLAALGLSGRAEVICAPADRALQRLLPGRERFELVFVDPPYRDDASSDILRRLVAADLLAPAAWVVVHQYKRAPEAGAPELEAVARTVTGDHRVVIFRRAASPA